MYNGIKIYQYSKNNIISQNIISNNVVGIDSSSSKNNFISDNYFYNNSEQGIYFYTSSNENIFSKNIFIYNDQALRIKGSSNNNLYKNYFFNNSYGVYFCCAARNNRAYNNTFIDNIDSNAFEGKGLINDWNAETASFGNYWDDYNGVDEDDDGIGDTDYSITGSERLDFYPLINPVDVDYYFKDKISK